jgi:putative transposase
MALYHVNVFTAFKYRLYPNSSQKVLIEKHFGCVRWVFNQALSIKTQAWTEQRLNISRFDLSAYLPKWKSNIDTEWLKEVNSQSLQAALSNLDSAYTRFFRLKSGFPKFKSKRNHQSFQVPQSGKVGVDFVQIPKIGKIKAVISRECSGLVKTITISRTPTGRFFASVICDDGLDIPAKMPIIETATTGIDLGIKDFAVLSTGEKIANPSYLKKSLRALKKRGKILSRKKNGSKNKDKARKKLAKIHEKVSNQRKDFLHKTTTRLVRDSQTSAFAIENLAVCDMIKNGRLARSISDAGWGEFRRQLEYKAERAGKTVLVIGRFEPSSKLCPCGIVNDSLKLSDRVWTCSCGLTHDRDLLAANNIKRLALHPQNKLIGRDAPESTLEEILT